MALVRLGKAESVWPLLRPSADPRVRSFVVNWLNPLGADPRAIAAELDRLDNVGRGSPDPTVFVGRGSPDPALSVGRGSPDPAQGPDRRSPAPAAAADSGRPSVPERAAILRVPGDPRPTESGDPRPTNAMDAILFHPETSQRRALILALGTYGPEGLSPGERESLAAKLLAVYRDDPDAGVQGAAAWTLRRWGLKDKIAALDAELGKLKGPGGRGWYVNGQGQTFAVIAGPVEFRMGAPADEPERLGGSNDQSPRRMTIPRRYAIAATEVTIPQFQKFLKTNASPRYNVTAGFLAKYSPDPDGPWIGLDWYTAAHYCNWLSEQEGLPRDQWCYVPAEEGGYADGMTVPADVLLRTGYRLLTEAEWEYACRSGTITSRYYGASTDLLPLYAQYSANSHEHTWACGSLLPNDLGLFDMLGNEFEWVHDEFEVTRPGRHGSFIDNINIFRYVRGKDPRLLRGGSFSSRAAFVRSALRNRYARRPVSRTPASVPPGLTTDLL